MRWTEEITLVQDEMRRVCAYLSFYANWWSSHAGIGYLNQYDPFLAEGMAAYAERQAHLRTSLQSLFLGLWKDVEAWVEGKKCLIVDTHQMPKMMTMMTCNLTHILVSNKIQKNCYDPKLP